MSVTSHNDCFTTDKIAKELTTVKIHHWLRRASWVYTYKVGIC